MPETRKMLVHMLLMLILCCRASWSDEAEKAPGLCGEDKEVIFLLDSPKSIDKDQFQRVLSFVRDMIDRFQESNNETRIAVVILSVDRKDDIEFDAYQTLEELKTLVGNIGSSDTTNSNNNDNNRNAKEPDVSISAAIGHAERLFSIGVVSDQIMICVTNDVATKKDAFLKMEEDGARELQQKIIAIGVGGKEVREGLKLIATEDSRDFIYSVEDFRDLSSLVDPLSYSMCLDAAICRGKPLQVVFLLHNSSSEDAANFGQVIDFTKHIVTALDIGPNATQVAAVAYGQDSAVKLFLNRSITKYSVLEALQEEQFPSSEDPKTSLALTTLKDSVFSEEEGDVGQNITRVVIVLTSGPLHDLNETKKAAQDLKNEGVQIIVIGVGGANPEELESIASMSVNQSEPLHFEPDDYNGLSSIQDKVVDRMCQDLSITYVTATTKPGVANTTPVNVPTKPEVVNTTPVKVTTKPEVINTPPVKVTIKPEVVSTTPVNVPTKPEVVSTTPVNVPTKPEVINTTPVKVTIKPEVVNTTPVNVPTTLEVVNTTPMKVTTKPGVVSTTPVNVPTKPEVVNTTPVKVTTKPGVVNTTPVKVTTKPEVVNTTPVKVTTKPEVITTIPASTTTKAEVVNTTPVKVTTKPEVITTIPASSTTKAEVINTTTVNTTTKPGDTVNPACRGKPLEVVFVLHNSTKVGAANFSQVIDFTKHIVTALDIGPNATQVAAVAYGQDTAVQLFFNRSNTKHSILEALQGIHFSSSGGPKTSLALTTLKDSVFSEEGGEGGDNTTRVVIVITEGSLQDLKETKKAAQELKDDGVKIIAIGVGGANPEELESIASMSVNQSEPLHFEPDDYSDLSSIQDKVIDRMCQERWAEELKKHQVKQVPSYLSLLQYAM